MVKIAKYLKPFLVGLILAVALLFVQAICEINLPSYMSNIVNVGLQQNGIEHAAPEAISENGMKFMTALMTDAQRDLVSEHYQLVSRDDKNRRGQKYSSLYPDAGPMLYVIRDVDGETMDSLDNAFGSATWTFVNVMKDMAGNSASGSYGGMESVKDIDISKLYGMLPMLGMLPQEVLDSARSKALANDATILKQSGIMLAQLFYRELGVDINANQTSYIIKVGSIMLAIALLGGVATILVSLLSSKISAGFSRNLRRDLFNKIESFSNREFDKFSTASLITRCTNDVTQIQNFFMFGIRMVCYAPIMGIGGVIMAVRKSVSMSWIIALACIVLIGVIMVIMSIALPKFKSMQKLVDRLNLVSRENLSGMMVIRAFGTQEHEKSRFERANGELAGTTLFINRVMAFMFPFMTVLMNGVTLIIVWVGAHQIAQSSMQVGDMMAFLQYAIQIIMSFLMISAMFIFIPRAAVSAGRIAEVLETVNSVVDPEEPESFDGSKKGLVEFKNVSFRYEGAEEYAVTDITFTAKPGETTAIIGPTGAGKSTIAQLLLRFYDVTEGEIRVDGVDIRKVRQKDLRKKIGYVPQKGVLLSGTIESNIKYGNKDASREEVETAAKIAQAMDFISEKPEGFDSQIAQGGTNVSGGQKQRLSIARALATRPEIYIFDDSFSALDFRTDLALRKALKEYTGDSTVIVVAQRVSTIMNAEQILVLDEGRIVGRGTHKELLKTCPQYYEIASSQLSREELA